MAWTVVTGAGASRELGRDRPLPLMGDWAASVCTELDGREHGLAGAAGLKPDMASDEFERALGEVMSWRRARTLAPKFFGLTGAKPGKILGNVQQAHANEDNRMNEIVEGIRTSLYAEFGTDRIDEGAAASAYETFLGELGNPTDLVFATTNYDPSIELALQLLEREADTGFRRPPARTPELAPSGLVESASSDDRVPVLHLHGAVGWYERSGKVVEYSPDQEYNPSHGTPAVLYPDPDKDPTQDAAVQTLWTEFEAALQRSDRVLVIGHSLNDPVLVETLKAHSSRRRLAVAVDLEVEDREAAAAAVEARLPGAAVVYLHFGPKPAFDASLREWLAATLEAA